MNLLKGKNCHFIKVWVELKIQAACLFFNMYRQHGIASVAQSLIHHMQWQVKLTNFHQGNDYIN